MPSTSATSKTTSTKATGTQTVDSVKSVDQQESPDRPPRSSTDAVSREENLLKEYSKEIYVYTLDLLNSVRIDNAHKGVNGKAYMLKRTVSDIAVPLKTMAIGGAAAAAKGAKGAAAPA